MRPAGCRGILDGIEIAAAPGKTAQALQLAAHFKSLGFLTVVSGIDVASLDLMAPGDGLDAVDALGITRASWNRRHILGRLERSHRRLRPGSGNPWSEDPALGHRNRLFDMAP